jgi:SAM-dependent methyltransferase
VSEALPASYFDRMYADHEDPWDFTGRWYEARKRAVTMASLPRPRFERAFEPGCSIGLLTELLSARCDELVAWDVSPAAVESAQQRLGTRPGVRVECRSICADWPDGRFDLVVISEIAYYLDESGAQELGRAAAHCLTDTGLVVLCHWLHPVEDYPLAGRHAQRLVRQASGLETAVRHQESDFLLEVLHHAGAPSVAAAEGLVAGSASFRPVGQGE